MVMPRNLIFIRHGESEGNVANRASRAGNDIHFKNEAFLNRHPSHYRLSDKGVSEAEWAGEHIRSLDMSFGRKYVSPYIRAMETMSLLRLGGPAAFVSYELRERSWGEMDVLPHEERMTKFAASMRRREADPYLWYPPGGEALVEVQTRIRDFLSTLWRECGDINVICVCHAEVIEVARVVLERKMPRDYVAMRNNKAEDVWNCSILHYTRKNPMADKANCGVVSEHLDWVRLMTPPNAHEKGAVGFDWAKVARPVFSDDDLMKYVEQYPRVIEG